MLKAQGSKIIYLYFSFAISNFIQMGVEYLNDKGYKIIDGGERRRIRGYEAKNYKEGKK